MSMAQLCKIRWWKAVVSLSANKAKWKLFHFIFLFFASSLYVLFDLSLKRPHSVFGFFFSRAAIQFVHHFNTQSNKKLTAELSDYGIFYMIFSYGVDHGSEKLVIWLQCVFKMLSLEPKSSNISFWCDVLSK